MDAEHGLNLDVILTLRILYGFLTYLDNAGKEASPAGTYSQFLRRLDPTVRRNLDPDDAFHFLETMTSQAEEPHTFILLVDEFNSARSLQVGLCPAARSPDCDWSCMAQ